jgi:hypothetical protein
VECDRAEWQSDEAEIAEYAIIQRELGINWEN